MFRANLNSSEESKWNKHRSRRGKFKHFIKFKLRIDVETITISLICSIKTQLQEYKSK
jgi:hypothetical protein